MSINGPVLDLIERFNFTFALDDQPQSHGLHPACRQTASYLIPEQWRYLISHQPIKHAARLLCVYQVAIDVAGMLERFAHRPLCDFVERHPADASVFLGLLSFLFAADSVP